MARPLLVAIVALGVPACTLLVSTSDLSGGGPPVADSGRVIESEAGPIEAATDAHLIEPELDSGFSCAAVMPAPTLCSSFDDAAFDPSAWDTTMTATGSVAIENGALVTTTGSTGEAYRPAYVQKNFKKLTLLHIDSDVRVDAVDPDTLSDLGGRFFGIKGDGWNAMLGLDSDGSLHVTENWGADGGDHLLHGMGTFVIGTWFHISFDVAFTTKAYTVLVDGKKISDDTALAGPIDAATPAVVIGVYFAPVSTGSWKIAYDNVVITAK